MSLPVAALKMYESNWVAPLLYLKTLPGSSDIGRSIVNLTQSKLASSRLAVLFGSLYGRFSRQSSPAVIVRTWRIVIRRLRSSTLATLLVSKNFRMGVSRSGNSFRAVATRINIEVTVLVTDCIV